MHNLTSVFARILASVTCFSAALAQGGGVGGGANYDRIITPDDITITPISGGGGVGGTGGWRIRATAWLANESPVERNLGCRVNIVINGVLVGSSTETVMVSNAGGGGGCMSSCVTDGWCAACRPSIIVPGTCYCCNHSVSTEIVVDSLAPGDVVAAWVVPLAGSESEIATANDTAFIVIPTPGGYNRLVKPNAVHYGRTSSGEFALAGEVTLQSNWDGVDRNLGTDVLVLVNGTPFGGGNGGGCNSTALIIYMGAGSYLSGSNPPLFSCSDWCALCQHTNGNPNGNICLPPAPVDSSPHCFCDENCTQSRIVPGYGWQVIVPQLSANDLVTVAISPHPGALAELNTSDDATIVRVADVALCPAVLADLGRQGGVIGGDGQFDNNDFIAFIGLFFDADPRADLGKQGGLFGPDGHFDNNDFIVFINLFFAGC